MQDIIERKPPPIPELPPLRKRISWTFVLVATVGASTAFVGFMLKVLLSGFRPPW